MLKVHSIETFGTQDGPGIRLVVFAQGCNFRCVYCHNPDTQPHVTKESKDMSSDEIIAMLMRQRGYFGSKGGLTVSGGEPTLQMEGLIDLFTKAKAHGFHTCLDTNGAFFNELLKRLYEVTDLVLLDVKHIDPTWHLKVTKQPLDTVLACAKYREETGKPMWLRYVLVPGWTDQPEHIESWARYFQDYQTVEKIEILPYHLLGAHKYDSLGIPNPLAGVKPPSEEIINHTKEIFKRYLKNVVI